MSSAHTEARAAKTPATILAKKVINDLRGRGFLTGLIGPHANILILRCPMVYRRANAEHALGLIDDSLTASTLQSRL